MSLLLTRRFALRSGAAGILLAALAVGGGCQEPELSDQSRVAIRKVLDDQRDAWNRGDIEGFMAGYHRDVPLTFTSGGKIRRGYDETLAGYRRKYIEAKGAEMGTLAFDQIEIQSLGPNSGLVLGHWKLTETPEPAEGIFSLVFLQSHGRWAIVHDHTSVLAGS